MRVQAEGVWTLEDTDGQSILNIALTKPPAGVSSRGGIEEPRPRRRLPKGDPATRIEVNASKASWHCNREMTSA